MSELTRTSGEPAYDAAIRRRCRFPLNGGRKDEKLSALAAFPLRVMPLRTVPGMPGEDRYSERRDRFYRVHRRGHYGYESVFLQIFSKLFLETCQGVENE